MFDHTDLKATLIEAFRYNPNRWILLDQDDLESLADQALSVRELWKCEEPE